MTRRLVDRFLAVLPLTLLPGCTFGGPTFNFLKPDAGNTRWIVVEKQASDLSEEGAWSVGQMQSGATILALAPVLDATTWTPTIHAADYFVELLDVNPKGRVEVGQVVVFSVRVGNAKADAIYKLTASPQGTRTRMLSPNEMVVTGRAEIEFRFTSVEGGIGAIGVEVEPLR